MHDALEHFRTNWDDKREQLTGSLQAVGTMALEPAEVLKETGDELVVQRLACVYTETGRAIDASARTLRRLADLDGCTGKAAERFGEAADDVAGDLAKAEKRYAMAGEALGTFVRPVGDARDESWAALAAALEAEADLSHRRRLPRRRGRTDRRPTGRTTGTGGCACVPCCSRGRRNLCGAA